MTARLLAAGLLAILAASAASASPPGLAIVTQDRTPLRGAARDAAPAHAVLWQGDALEVRGERLAFLQVYDHRRERAGFVRASQVRRLALGPEDAPELLSVLRFLRDTPGSESLGIAIAAAYLRAAPAAALAGEAGVEALDALGVLAERLARRGSSHHLEVAGHYGVRFTTHERGGRVRVCYDGEAFLRVLAMPSGQESRARAALALTREDCLPALRASERLPMDQWRADVLDRVEDEALPGYLRNRLRMRRAAVWASLAFQLARQGEAAAAAGTRAAGELARIDKSELAHEDAREYREAAMRVGVSRWAAAPAAAPAPPTAPRIVTLPGQPGETCILLVDAKHGVRDPLARRCTYGIVWARSASLNREGSAVALAVQPTASWREIWLFRKAGSRWTVRVVPPAALTPGIGYAELAGWVPGGRQMLVAREALGDGKYERRFELVRLDDLAAVRQSSDPAALRSFQRWQDPAWKRQTLSMR